MTQGDLFRVIVGTMILASVALGTWVSPEGEEIIGWALSQFVGRP